VVIAVAGSGSKRSLIAPYVDAVHVPLLAEGDAEVSALTSVGAITLFVEDPQRSKLFYEDVFGLPVTFEDENSAAFRFENTIINLLKIPAARAGWRCSTAR